MAVSELTIGEFVAALGEKTPSPASGAATAITGAFAAALVELAARFAHDDEAVTRARELATRLTELADADADAYADYMSSRNEETRGRTIAVPEEIAATATKVEQLATQIRARLASAVAGDAEAAGALARAAADVARRLAELNAATD